MIGLENAVKVLEALPGRVLRVPMGRAGHSGGRRAERVEMVVERVGGRIRRRRGRRERILAVRDEGTLKMRLVDAHVSPLRSGCPCIARGRAAAPFFCAALVVRDTRVLRVVVIVFVVEDKTRTHGQVPSAT